MLIAQFRSRSYAVVLALVTAAAASMSGCTSGDQASTNVKGGGASRPPSAGSTSTAGPVSTVTTNAAPTTTEPTASPSPTPAIPTVTDGVLKLPSDRPVAFVGATGTTVCLIEPAAVSVRCDVPGNKWRLPPAPTGCSEKWGAGVEYSGKAGLTCSNERLDRRAHTDSADTWWRDSGGKTLTTARGQEVSLPVGVTIEAGPFQCTNAGLGVSCTHQPTGSAITASPAQYSFRVGATSPGRGYTAYTNVRYGFRTQVPTGWQTISTDHGAVLRPTPGTTGHRDGQPVTVTITGRNNTERSTTATEFARATDELSHSGTITASAQFKSSYTLSAHTAADRIVRERTWVGPGSINTMRWEYPASLAADLDPAFDKAVASFTPGDLTRAH